MRLPDLNSQIYKLSVSVPLQLLTAIAQKHSCDRSL